MVVSGSKSSCGFLERQLQLGRFQRPDGEGPLRATDYELTSTAAIRFDLRTADGCGRVGEVKDCKAVVE